MPETKAEKKRFAALQKEYGKKKGEQVFYAMRNQARKKAKGRK